MLKLSSSDKDNDVPSKLPNYGPLDIQDWKKFLRSSKSAFEKNWSKPFLNNETLSNFDLISKLGRGSFGSVVLVKHHPSGEFYAMKATSKSKIIKFKQLDHTLTEKLVLQNLNFPFTVYLIYCFKDNSYVYFVMPYVFGGELFELLRKLGRFDEVLTRFYISQMILAIEYLHHLDIIYRDLKPENILIDHTGYLKLADFGLSKRITGSCTYTLCGTTEYLAPEILLSKGYGKSVDWWTVGILLFEFAAGRPPFFGTNPMNIFEKIVNLSYQPPPYFSANLKDLVSNILQADLSKRFGNLKSGVDDIKDHLWFRQTNWMAVLNRKAIVPYKPMYKEPQSFKKKNWKPLKISEEEQYVDEFADF